LVSSLRWDTLSQVHLLGGNYTHTAVELSEAQRPWRLRSISIRSGGYSISVAAQG
jgi:hypothetical protein